MIRPAQQNGFILMPVVLAIALIATLAFLLNNQSAINVSETGDMLEAEQAEQLAQAALAHAIWGAQSSGCAGDMSMTSVPFGPGNYSATVDSAATTTNQYSFNPDQDTTILESSPAVTGGSDAELKIKEKTSAGQIRSLLHYDLSTIPAGARVTSATAWFYVTLNNNVSSVYIHPVTASWIEASATWNSIASSFDSSLYGTISPQSTSGVWVSVNLAALAQAWVNDASTNYGIMLIGFPDAVSTQFASSEYSTTSLRPYLQVTTAVGDVSPLSITATGTLTGNPSPANDVTRSLTRVNVPAYQPGSYTTLQPGAASGKDAEIYDQAPNNNYGNAAETWVSSASNDTTRSLLSFDMGEIPAGARILEATLSLHRQSGSGADQPVSAHRISNPWSEDSVSWNSRETGTNWDTAGGDYDNIAVATTPVGPVNQRYEWNITPLAQGWVDGSYPNYGVALTAAIAGMAGERFYTSDHADLTLHPKLSITYACECGSTCLAPQGTGNVLMAVVNPSTLVPADARKKALFESWGYTVAVISESANQTAIDTAASNNDVVYVSNTANSNQLGGRLAGVPIGVVNEDGDYNADFGTSSSSSYSVAKVMDVIDTSHYITALFPAGMLPIYSANMENLLAAGTLATDLQILGSDFYGAPGLAVVETGGLLADGSSTAAGRRVVLPIGRNGSFNWDYLNNSGRLMVQRALQWGTGNTGGAPVLIYRDEFSNRNCDAADYTGSNGTLDWSPWAWVEAFDDSTSCGGKFGIAEDPVVIEPGNNRLKISGNNISIARQVDLSAFTQAHLSFDYRPDAISNNVHVIFEAWDDVGGAWVEVGRHSGPMDETVYASTSYDISPYISINAAIRIVTSGLGILEVLYIDNLQISETAPPLSEPIAYWKLDETTGTIVVDSVGGHDGTLSGAAWSSGLFDGALGFNGVSDYVDLGTAPTLDNIFDSGATVTAWINPAGWGEGDFGRILDKADSLGGNRNGWAFELYGSQQALFFQHGFSGAIGNFQTPTGSISLDTWQHVAVVFDNSSDLNDPLLYIDGVAQTVTETSTPSGTRLSDSGITLTMGNYFIDFSRTFDGLLDDVRIYDRMLTEAEIAELAVMPPPPGYFDTFNSRNCNAGDYAGSDGQLDWSGFSWLENSESDGSCAGLVAIGDDPAIAEPGSYRLILDEKNTRIVRQVDLSGFASAHLSFDYRRYNYPTTSDKFTVEITDGGGSWDVLGEFTGIASDPAYLSTSYDISAWATADTQIAFATSGSNTVQTLYLDNIHITETGGGGGGGGPANCDGTFRDEFETVSYSNNDGSLSWASDWIEINESDGANAGDEKIMSDTGHSSLRLTDNDGGGEGVEREADLSGAATASISLLYRRNKLDDINDKVKLWISANGAAGPWSELIFFAGGGTDSDYVPFSLDISTFISANTRIRFLTSSTMGGRDEVYFDDIQIVCSP